MNVRIAAAGLMALLALAACTSSTNGSGGSTRNTGPSSPTSTGPASTTPATTTSGAPSTTAGTTSSGGGGVSDVAFCTKLQQAETKLSNLGASASDPSKLRTAVTEELAFFKDLENGAPPDVAGAIHDLRTALEQVGVYIEHPSSSSTGALQALSTKLPADAQKIATYVTTHCR